MPSLDRRLAHLESTASCADECSCRGNGALGVGMRVQVDGDEPDGAPLVRDDAPVCVRCGLPRPVLHIVYVDGEDWRGVPSLGVEVTW